VKLSTRPETFAFDAWKKLDRNMYVDGVGLNDFQFAMYEESERVNPSLEWSSLHDFDIMYCAGGEL